LKITDRGSGVTEAEQPVPWWRLARVRRVLACIGQALVVDMSVTGLWSAGMMIDATTFRAVNEWAKQSWRGLPDPGADDRLLPAPPAPSPERLIPEVPLSPGERVLWSDLLGARPPERAGRRLRPLRVNGARGLRLR
jgi:hypothetical protein